jgi:hypothetical protein
VGTVSVSALLISEIKRIIKDSEITKEDDLRWPKKNKDGRQELEIRLGTDHIQFEVRCIRVSMAAVIDLFGIDGEDWLIGRCHRLG